ncbi:MAG: HEAT repeat domain-containing protein [Kofleriaceae bacterium]
MRSTPSLVLASTCVAAVTAMAAATGCGPSPSVRHATALIDRGDYQAASQYTEAELAKQPDDVVLHRLRLRALLGTGDAASAVADYRAWRAAHGGTEDGPALRTMALTTVWQAVRSPSAALKVTAIRAVERLELEELATDVGRAMGDDDDQVVAAAAVAVLRAFPQAPDAATQMLRSDDPAARAIAVEGIGRKVKGLAADDLRPLAGDPDPRVRAAVASYLGAIRDRADTARLLALAADANAEVRTAALRALAASDRGGGRDLAARAQAGLADEALGPRLAAVALTARLGGAAALTPLFLHADPMVAATAAKAAKDRAAAAAALDRALASSEITIRAGAVNLLGAALANGEARARAAAATADPAPRVRLAAARALAYLGDRPGAIAALAPMLGADDLHDRADAAAELARADDPRGPAALIELGASTDPTVRAAVVAAHLAAGLVGPGLWGALADPQAGTRLDAAIALLTLGER